MWGGRVETEKKEKAGNQNEKLGIQIILDKPPPAHKHTVSPVDRTSSTA